VCLALPEGAERFTQSSTDPHEIFMLVLFWRIFLVLVEANTHHILRQGANNNFTRFCLKFFSLPEDCTVLGGNGNTLNTRWRLNLVKKECPAPQSQSIPYRLIPLLTPHSSGWTLPLRNIDLSANSSGYALQILQFLRTVLSLTTKKKD